MENSPHPVATSAASAFPWLLHAGGCAQGWQQLLLEHPSGGNKDEVQRLGSSLKELQSVITEGGLDGEPRWSWAGLDDLYGKSSILAAPSHLSNINVI